MPMRIMINPTAFCEKLNDAMNNTTVIDWERTQPASMRPTGDVLPITNYREDAELGCTPKTNASINVAHDKELNAKISSYQTNLLDWKLAGLSLSDLAARLHNWADNLWSEFVPKAWKETSVAKPNFLFLFEWESPRVLGHYRPGRNAAGCRWEISLNPVNLTRLSEIEVASVALHELFHCFEDIVGSAPTSRNGYHSTWLRNIADQVGIPCTRFGCTCGIRPGSPFSEWARRQALTGTPVLKLIPEHVEPAKPKRKPWVCNCTSGQAITIHVAVGSRLRARCEVCGTLFHPKDLTTNLPTGRTTASSPNTFTEPAASLREAQ
jgi:hypothetical protein